MATFNAAKRTTGERFKEEKSLEAKRYMTSAWAANDNTTRTRAANDNGAGQSMNPNVVNATQITRTVSADFSARKSLQAKTKQLEILERKAANDNREREWQRSIPTSSGMGDVTPASAGAQKSLLAKGAKFAIRRLPLGFLFPLAWFCWFWTFIFGIAALLFIIGGHYDIFWGLTPDQIAGFLSGTIGDILEAGINIVGFFFGFHIDLPAATFSAIGAAFWALTILINILGYIVILISAGIAGSNPFNSSGGVVVLGATLALSLCFLTQLFPWMPLFVLYLMLQSTSEELSP